MINKELLHTATTQDYNDMREMITELEQKLIGVDPVKQMTFYSALQNRLYEMLYLDSNEDSMILYSHPVQPINYN